MNRSSEPKFAPSSRADTRPTSVYRYYDAHGILIYVGITKRGTSRNLEHNKRAAWWPYVVRQEVDHLASARAAAARERELIRLHRPPFNTQHNPYAGEVRAEYLAWVALPPADPATLARALNRVLPLRLVEQDPWRLVLSTSLEHCAVAKLVRPLEKGERILIAGYSARLAQLVHHGPLLLIHALVRTERFPRVITGEAQIKFVSQKPVAFRLSTVRVVPEELTG